MRIGARKSLGFINNPPPAAGNIITQPYEMTNAYWNLQTNIGSSLDSTLSPGGDSLADLIIPNGTSSNSHRVGKTTGGIGTTTAADWILRLRVKPAGYNIIWMILGNNLSYTKQTGVQFNLGGNGNTNIITETTYKARPRIQKLADGWYLCEISVSVDANSTHVCEFRIMPQYGTAAYSGDLTAGMYLWGAEFLPAA